jgi:hypothetical protein
MIKDPNILARLQNWYLSQCNGDWEHTYCISITTLDNPGWRFSVDLKDTNLYDCRFDPVRFNGNDKDDWYDCRVDKFVFDGACGPTRLNDVMALFLDWADQCP